MSQKMRLNTSRKSVSFCLQTLSAAVLSTLLFASHADAAALGKLTIKSALGQPLNAEIELSSVTPGEDGLLQPRVASVDAYKSAGIEFNPVLYSLRFTVAKHDDGRQYIAISSTQAVNEPFVDMLLELGGNGSGRLLREYTFLLDPADMSARQAPATSSSRPLQTQGGSQVATTPLPADNSQSLTQRPSSRRPGAAPVPTPAQPVERPQRPVASQPAERPAGASAGQSEYTVKAGDSLSKIAGQVKPEGVSLDQMLVAIYRNNQSAFGGNNMNRLRAGQVLSVPDAATASAISAGEAHHEIMAQAADFNEYRNKLAGQVAATPAPKQTETSSKQSATGKVTTKVEEKSTPATTAQDKLKLSKGGAPDKNSKVGAGEEERIAKEKELAEANARVKALEKNVNDLKSLLDVKSKNVPEPQKAQAKADTKPVTPAPTPAPAPAPVIAPAPTPAPAASATAAASVPAPVKPADVKPPETKPVEAAKPADSSASVMPPSKPPKPKPRPAPPEPSLVDEILNPLVIGGAALLLVAGGAFGVYRGYRKRKEKAFGDSIITDSSLKANSLFGSTGGQSVDTNNSVFNSNFAPSASQLDSNEVDPVAEADVYIAYGRDAQAEEILKEALRTQPDRNAVRVKLLEIYANRKDVRSFETVATELYGMTKGEGEDWHQAAALGMSIDPKNPLYSVAGTTHGGTPADMAKTMALSTQMHDTSMLDDLVPNTHGGEPQLGGPTLGQPEPDTLARHGESHPHGDNPLDVSTSLDFDLDGIGDEPTHEPAHGGHGSHDVPAAKHEVAAPAPADFSNIDFDFLDDKKSPEPETEHHELGEATTIGRLDTHDTELHDLSDELPAVPTIKPEEVPTHAKIEPAAMDFDLSGLTLELDSSKDATTVLPDHKAEAHVPDLELPVAEHKSNVVDFHIPDVPAVPHVPEPAPAPANEHAMDFHIPDIHTAEVHAPEVHEHAAPKLEEPAPLVDIGEIPGLNPAPAPHAGEHLSVPDLHIPSVADHVDHGDGGHHVLEAPVELDTGVDHEYSNNAEMATKLDLAVAYQEIGDKEGARELLDEVMKGGIPEYAEKAKGLLAKLG
jgi:pilus assembly protein FimV